jgi:branched-chain amino acid transport system substrate-binding protein
VLVALAVLAACSGDGDSAVTTTTGAPTPTTSPRTDDGVLAVGAIIPSGGALPDLGASMRGALEVARNEIDDAGGIGGRPLRLTIIGEGESTASAIGAVNSLVDSGVDAIIGPTSSVNLLSTLSTAVQAGVLTCTPTGSALALDDFPADGLLVRTIASDSLQAEAIAQVASDTGANDAVIVYLDDAYGRPLAAAVSDAIGNNPPVLAAVPFPADEVPPPASVQRVVDAAPDAVVVIADAVTGPAIISAIEAASAGRPTFVTNDALRRPDANATPFPTDLVDSRFSGVAPAALPPQGTFASALAVVEPAATGLYATNAYDCLTLIALGSIATGSDDGRTIAAALPELTSTGTRCIGFSTCLPVVQDRRNVDYDGPGLFLGIDASGRTTGAQFDVFTFDAETGRDVVSSSLVVGTT